MAPTPVMLSLFARSHFHERAERSTASIGRIFHMPFKFASTTVTAGYWIESRRLEDGADGHRILRERETRGSDEGETIDSDD
jgi:hypothetical protein